jgi:hypothetical protein
MTWVRFLLAWNAVWLFVWLLLCVSRADAAWYADPSELSVSTELNPDVLCDGFHEALLANEGVGDGICAYPEQGGQFWREGHPKSGTWEDASTYLPQGIKAASYFEGNTVQRRFSNSGVGMNWHSWEHASPLAPATCPLTPDESICGVNPDTGQCEEEWARNYNTDGVYPSPAEWSLRALDTRAAGEANVQSAREWGGSVSVSFPSALYVVATLGIVHFDRSAWEEFGPHWKWLFQAEDPLFFGAHRTLTLEALSCDGVATGEPAVVVDATDIYTGPSGQVWTEGCAIGLDTEGSRVLCHIGLGDGIIPVEGIQVHSIDGASVDLNHLRMGDLYTGSMPLIAPHPDPIDIPPGEAAERSPELTPLDVGCLSGPVMDAIGEAVPSRGSLCFYDTAHILHDTTHSGDGSGTRHPQWPAEVDYPAGEYPERVLGTAGHLYPVTWLPEPHPVQLFICGVALIAMLHALRRS